MTVKRSLTMRLLDIFRNIIGYIDKKKAKRDVISQEVYDEKIEKCKLD